MAEYSKEGGALEKGNYTTTSPEPAISYGETHKTDFEQLSFWTRSGCTLESFKRRKHIDGVSELNTTLKPRHLHMIAIGGSIGAGLFVGSGSALRRGVRQGPYLDLCC